MAECSKCKASNSEKYIVGQGIIPFKIVSKIVHLCKPCREDFLNGRFPLLPVMIETEYDYGGVRNA